MRKREKGETLVQNKHGLEELLRVFDLVLLLSHVCLIRLN